MRTVHHMGFKFLITETSVSPEVAFKNDFVNILDGDQ